MKTRGNVALQHHSQSPQNIWKDKRLSHLNSFDLCFTNMANHEIVKILKEITIH